jgi:hypothetical protein
LKPSAQRRNLARDLGAADQLQIRPSSEFQSGDNMSKQIDQDRFTANFFDILDETFENHHGIYLDKGTSLFETLETITAAEASRPVSSRCASLAAQVAHVNFYLEVLERYIATGQADHVDWGEIWRTVEAVTPEEWTALKQQLKQTYQRILILLRSLDIWGSESAIGDALAVVVHTAYHLGEIRQALCTIKQR